MKNSKLMLKVLLAMAVGFLGLVGTNVASAQSFCNNQNTASAQDDACANEGDADAEANQEGNASSGDGVAGQVAGVVSAGDASVDATNRSDDVDVETGEATGRNVADVFADTGVFNGGANACNNQLAGGAEQGNACHNDGDADAAADQSADAASGDGVGGQVIGVVTSAGGSADLVLDNESTDSDVTSGNADFENDSAISGDSAVFNVGPAVVPGPGPIVTP